MTLTGITISYLLGSPAWDPVTVWHKSLAMAPSWVVGPLHPEFSPGGRICPTITKVANLPLLKARWAHSDFHWYDYLAAVFVPFIDLGDVVAHIEVFTKFIQQALNDS